MATKNISLKVADVDPSGYTYVGLYADSRYTKELTTNKLYTFDVTSGSTTDLFLKYKKSPFTLSFKENSNMAYTISMSYNGTSYSIEVPIGSGSVERSFELPENATNQIIITSVVSTTAGQEVGNIKLDDAVITLPYTRVVSSWNGQTHVISVDNIQTTTTTTTSSSTTSSTTTLPSVTLKLKRVPTQDGTSDYMPYTFKYTITESGKETAEKSVYVYNEDVSVPITYTAGSNPLLNVVSLSSASTGDKYKWHSNKILYKKLGDTSYSTISIPTSQIPLDTSVGNEVTPVIYWDGPTTDVTFMPVKDVSGSAYINYTVQYVDSNFETKSVTVENSEKTVAALTPATSSHLWIINDVSTDAEIQYRKYKYSGTIQIMRDTTLTVNTPSDIIDNIENGYTIITPVFNYTETTTTTTSSTTSSTTSTPAPAVVNMTSNVSSTAYIIVPGQEDKTVTLAANTKTGVAIDID